MTKKSLNTHKTNLRNLFKDGRTHPRVKLLAELLLAHIEDIFPRPLIESIIVSEFIKVSKKPDDDIEELIDKKAMTGLKEQWEKLMEENDRDTNSDTDSDTSDNSISADKY